ncbi:MAG: hypothetical protein JSS63_10805 [Bacteroidetes bacterium]|nr:hypothetical protein [Bacteroidota bacterium]MBX7046870.1 hypothetical protein [Ignavibacteria bacterium]
MKSFTLSVFVVLCLIVINGCVNVDQKVTLKSDGSGTIKLHYWTGMKNLSMGDEIGGFSFSESGVKSNYTASGIEPSNIKIEENTDDSTKHVKLDISFKDFNKLSDAKGFAKSKTSWAKGKDGMDYKYTLLKDTANAGGMGMEEFKLVYETTFPGEVTATNGTKDGMKVTWNKTVADLKNDVEMTASVKGGDSGKKCGLFGMELPIIVGLGLMFAFTFKNKKKNKA